MGSDVRSSTTSPRERAVLVRERARGTFRVEERETHWLARGFFHAARALEVVEVRSGAAWGRGVDLDAGGGDSRSRAKASVIALSAVFDME